MRIEGKFNVGGEVVKQDERYVVSDNRLLKNLIVSSTRLNSGKETTGHCHTGQEEVYMFVEGKGEMLLDEKRFPVQAGDIILIEDGVFHRVYNTSEQELYFVCVFDGQRRH
jgi:oxalate decarboxylase/phosphoglucose isomerase-like protein (cupin superfamily)